MGILNERLIQVSIHTGLNAYIYILKMHYWPIIPLILCTYRYSYPLCNSHNYWDWAIPIESYYVPIFTFIPIKPSFSLGTEIYAHRLFLLPSNNVLARDSQLVIIKEIYCMIYYTQSRIQKTIGSQTPLEYFFVWVGKIYSMLSQVA